MSIWASCTQAPILNPAGHRLHQPLGPTDHRHEHRQHGIASARGILHPQKQQVTGIKMQQCMPAPLERPLQDKLPNHHTPYRNPSCKARNQIQALSRTRAMAHPLTEWHSQGQDTEVHMFERNRQVEVQHQLIHMTCLQGF